MVYQVGSKTVKQCIAFYYLWKKVCPDEYKRLRLIRKKKEQEDLFYNLRSRAPPPVPIEDLVKLVENPSDSEENDDHEDIVSKASNIQHQPVMILVLYSHFPAC